MNATAGPTAADGGGFLGSQNIGGFGYGIGVSIGILLLITTITLASYYCTRGQHPSTSSTSVADHHHRHVVVEIPEEVGIDEATLKSYPKLVYSDKRQKIVKEEDAPTAASCCSICLADYKRADVLRLLPDCGHLFHLKCVDPWLRKHPTCPVCRTSPFPSPMSTPLAEVVPLAGRPRG